MKALIKSALTLLCLALSTTPAIVLAHTGHGADGNLFHGVVHSDWIVVMVAAVIAVGVVIYQQRQDR